MLASRMSDQAWMNLAEQGMPVWSLIHNWVAANPGTYGQKLYIARLSCGGREAWKRVAWFVFDRRY